MTLKHLAAVGLVSASIFAVGCDKETTAPATETPSAGATGDKANAAAADLKMQAEGTQKDAASAMSSATGKMGASATDAKNAAAGAADSIVTQAQSLYAQAQSAISNAKFDDAQKYVDQLKGLRDKLPAEWQTRVDELGKVLTDAKAKMSNLPGGLSMPK